ncbi:MAG: sensor domain-containing diguanylate cyclase [Prochlorococcaceae cyanobacterium]
MAAYPAYPVPADEELRLRDLERHGLLDSSPDPHFDRIVRLAADIFHVPIALISLVDANRQWFLSRHGLDVCESPRETAFCAHAIAADAVLVVPDAQADERFSTNPLVTGEPHIRFYAGAPLRSPDGHNLGTLCVIDRQPRAFGPQEVQRLQLLAELAMREIELRLAASHCPVTGLPHRKAFFAIGAKEFARARVQDSPLSLLTIDVDNFRQINQRWGHPAGDQVLLDLCQLCRGFLNEVDYLARLGDEQFALLLVGRDHEAATALAEELRLAVNAMAGVFSHSDYQLHISGGLTSLGSGDHHFGELVLRADRALELAKGNGRDQIASLLGS